MISDSELDSLRVVAEAGKADARMLLTLVAELRRERRERERLAHAVADALGLERRAVDLDPTALFPRLHSMARARRAQA